MSKYAAVIRSNAPHQIDHIVPFCELLDATFLVQDEYQEEILADYPLVKKEDVPLSKLYPENIAINYEAVIHTFPWPKEWVQWWTKDRKFRSFFLPHGQSDKGFHSPILEYYPTQDIVLIYGKRMKEMLAKLGFLPNEDQMITIGNPRLAYYKKHKSHFDALAHDKVFSKCDPKKPNILYAPTWCDYESNSTFFSSSNYVLQSLSKDYNLIIKPHPLLTEENFAKCELFFIQCEDKENVVVVRDYHHIYSLLEKTDYLIGDLSSIGYDFLAFNRPLFFFNPGRDPKDPSLFLQSYGTALPMDHSLQGYLVKGLDNDSHFSQKRHELYKRTFSSVSLEEIKKTMDTFLH
jgi:CDP-glycerol glycerophosphotransferase (TagB/SpsB family)